MLQRLGIGVAIVLGTVTFLFVALVVLGMLIGDSSKEESISTAATAIASTPIPTEVSKTWKVEELADCDTTTLSAQARHMNNPNDPKYSWAKDSQLSDCEIEIFAGWMRMELARQERLQQGDTRIQGILDTISASQRTSGQMVEDKVIDPSEREFLCYILPQWEQQLKDAINYINSIKQDNEWQSLEIDFCALKT